MNCLAIDRHQHAAGALHDQPVIHQARRQIDPSQIDFHARPARRQIGRNRRDKFVDFFQRAVGADARQAHHRHAIRAFQRSGLDRLPIHRIERRAQQSRQCCFPDSRIRTCNEEMASHARFATATRGLAGTPRDQRLHQPLQFSFRDLAGQRQSQARAPIRHRGRPDRPHSKSIALQIIGRVQRLRDISQYHRNDLAGTAGRFESRRLQLFAKSRRRVAAIPAAPDPSCMRNSNAAPICSRKIGRQRRAEHKRPRVVHQNSPSTLPARTQMLPPSPAPSRRCAGWPALARQFPPPPPIHAPLAHARPSHELHRQSTPRHISPPSSAISPQRRDVAIHAEYALRDDHSRATARRRS